MTERPRKPRILVVDDQPDIRLMCRVNLAFDGYEVVEAGTGEEALALARRVQPDLILLDVMMPAMDGWQVLARLKTDPTTEEIPVVLLTALVAREDEVRGWMLGAADYLPKPFNPGNLAETLRRTLHAVEPESDRRRHALRKLSIS